jgi:hypothetical protein
MSVHLCRLHFYNHSASLTPDLLEVVYCGAKHLHACARAEQ